MLVRLFFDFIGRVALCRVQMRFSGILKKHTGVIIRTDDKVMEGVDKVPQDGV